MLLLVILLLVGVPAALAWAAAGLPSERLWLPKHGETLEVE